MAESAINPDTGEAVISSGQGRPDPAGQSADSGRSLLVPDQHGEQLHGLCPAGCRADGMLGIGVAERTGMIGAMLKAFMKVVPKYLLTPTMVFLGIMNRWARRGLRGSPPPAAAV